LTMLMLIINTLFRSKPKDFWKFNQKLLRSAAAELTKIGESLF